MRSAISTGRTDTSPRRSRLRSTPVGLILVLVLVSACSLSSDDESARSGPRDAPGRSLTGLLYQRGDVLHLRNLATGADRVLARLPSRDVYAAPGFLTLAYVLSGRGPRRGGDFVEDPRLFLFDPLTGRRDESPPVTRPCGTRVAACSPFSVPWATVSASASAASAGRKWSLSTSIRDGLRSCCRGVAGGCSGGRESPSSWPATTTSGESRQLRQTGHGEAFPWPPAGYGTPLPTGAGS